MTPLLHQEEFQSFKTGLRKVYSESGRPVCGKQSFESRARSGQRQVRVHGVWQREQRRTLCVMGDWLFLPMTFLVLGHGCPFLDGLLMTALWSSFQHGGHDFLLPSAWLLCII